uniref:V-SNARE coiled-coil homology domain-containing protein n=1 Tax=Chromera velia CCMP2878 TaxID=1169474 RepID=A0A0G4HLB1_9ALVE|eukprot:Cvel_7416.t1-p1 / transcript=Cvel_7416.t1 / gene=Cvel_7416 / organism=Chromera_velia_CCMP2878 / gene_product=hypothetical protein / transcript_product=hypothetical protein / location=Cvel_scaffold387:54195-57119(+) / protein_length=844 / sequence_SO=supercontig / SO=protein_coding / is_pseudo=false
MEDQSGRPNLLFLGIGRLVEPYEILACHHSVADPTFNEETESISHKLLGAAKLKLEAEAFQRLYWEQMSICCRVDSSGLCLYILVTKSIDYPDEYAEKLLDEFVKAVAEFFESRTGGSSLEDSIRHYQRGALSRHLRGTMEMLLRKYENPLTADRLAALNQKTNSVKAVIEDSARQMLDRGHHLNDMVATTERMRESSRNFHSDSRAVHRYFWWQDRKILLYILAAIVGILVILLLLDQESRGVIFRQVGSWVWSSKAKGREKEKLRDEKSEKDGDGPEPVDVNKQQRAESSRRRTLRESEEKEEEEEEEKEEERRTEPSRSSAAKEGGGRDAGDGSRNRDRRGSSVLSGSHRHASFDEDEEEDEEEGEWGGEDFSTGKGDGDGRGGADMQVDGGQEEEGGASEKPSIEEDEDDAKEEEGAEDGPLVSGGVHKRVPETRLDRLLTEGPSRTDTERERESAVSGDEEEEPEESEKGKDTKEEEGIVGRPTDDVGKSDESVDWSGRGVVNEKDRGSSKEKEGGSRGSRWLQALWRRVRGWRASKGLRRRGRRERPGSDVEGGVGERGGRRGSSPTSSVIGQERSSSSVSSGSSPSTSPFSSDSSSPSPLEDLEASAEGFLSVPVASSSGCSNDSFPPDCRDSREAFSEMMGMQGGEGGEGAENDRPPESRYEGGAANDMERNSSGCPPQPDCGCESAPEAKEDKEARSGRDREGRPSEEGGETMEGRERGAFAVSLSAFGGRPYVLLPLRALRGSASPSLYSYQDTLSAGYATSVVEEEGRVSGGNLKPQTGWETERDAQEFQPARRRERGAEESVTTAPARVPLPLLAAGRRNLAALLCTRMQTG